MANSTMKARCMPALCYQPTLDGDRVAKRRRRSYAAVCASPPCAQLSGATSSLTPNDAHFCGDAYAHWHTSATVAAGADSERGLGVVTRPPSLQEENGTSSAPTHWPEGSLRDAIWSDPCTAWPPYNPVSFEAESATSSFLDGYVWPCPADGIPLCPLTPPPDGARMPQYAGQGGHTGDIYSPLQQRSLHWVGPDVGQELRHSPITPPPDGAVEVYGTQQSPTLPYQATDASPQTDRLHWVGPSFAEDLPKHLLNTLSEGHHGTHPMSDTELRQHGARLPAEDVLSVGASFVDGFQGRESAPTHNTPEGSASTSAPDQVPLRQYPDPACSTEPIRPARKRKRESQCVDPRTDVLDAGHRGKLPCHPETRKAREEWHDKESALPTAGEILNKERTRIIRAPNSFAPTDGERQLAKTVAGLAALESRERIYAEEQLKNIREAMPTLPQRRTR